jgi:hypothetical protein
MASEYGGNLVGGRPAKRELFGPFASFFVLRDPLRFAELVDD